MSGRYRDDPDDPARRNRHGRREPTRQPRRDNWLYCTVWADNNLFKIGLSSGKNVRETSAVRAIERYFARRNEAPGARTEWRTEFLPGLDNKAWGDCQRLEMVFATALKRRLRAGAAGAVGLEWFWRPGLQDVPWRDELTAAAAEALDFSGLDPQVEWKQPIPRSARDSSEAPPRIQGPSQRDAWRTRRNRSGHCALKDCGAEVGDGSVPREGFLYCSDAHATADLCEPAREQ